jgi:hypothetical protein
MAPRKTRAIGIFANSACVESLTLRKYEWPLFPNADVQTNENGMNLGFAFGHNRPSVVSRNHTLAANFSTLDQSNERRSQELP